MRLGGNWSETVEKSSELTSVSMDVQTCCCPHSFYPWIKKPFYEPSMEGLNEQIKHFVEWVAPTEEERLMRADVCRRIERVVSNIWPNAVTETIGSTCTDLCVPTSDIDMVIFGVSMTQNGNTDGVQTDTNAFAIECLYKLAKNLEDVAQRNSIEVLNSAKVPIIKMRDRKSGIEVDISFGVFSGKENSKVVLEYCKKYPLVKPLTLVIKYYLKQKFLNNSWSGGIGSYTLVIMIISYLQLHAKNYGSETTLADHLLGFFCLYGSQFNYVETVISIVNEGKYLRKSDKNWMNDNNPSLLSVEDPHNPDNDVGCIAFKIENAKEAFFQAYNILSEAKSQLASPASSEKESRKIHSDFSYSQPDLNVSQLMWVNYSLQCFRARIKTIYRTPDSTDVSACPLHPTTKTHGSLSLSSTRYFNNGTKPHKSKNCGPSKDSNRRLIKKANNNNSNNTNNNNTNYNNNNTNNYNLNYNYNYNYNSNNSNYNNSKNTYNNNKNCISLHMDENSLNVSNPWRGEAESNSKINRSQDKIYKIVSADFPGLAKNTPGVSYQESPSI